MTDSQARDYIIEHTDENLFVVAGAGSGKTSMLVNRMVSMIEEGVDIKKICAITFTKNAAAEFLDRVEKKLYERSIAPNVTINPKPGDFKTSNDDKRARCKKALEDIDLCFMGTIDSFCNQILSEMPIDAGIPSNSKVIEDDEAEILYRSEYKKVANDDKCKEYDSFLAFNKLHKNGVDVFNRSIVDVIETSIVKDVEFITPIQNPEDELTNKITNIYEKDIKDDIKRLLNLEINCIDKDAFNEFKKKSSIILKNWNVSNIADIQKALNSIRKIDNFRFDIDPCTSIIEFSYMPRKNVYKYKKTDLEKGIVNSLDDVLDKIDEYIYEFSMDFLLKMKDRIRKVLKEEGKLTYNEYLITFVNMLKNDVKNGGKIKNHIVEKYSYYLIDEAQDTSPLQYELFITLASKNLTDDIKLADPREGSLYICGDVKQSIYRFRGADIKSYKNIMNLFNSVYDSKLNKVIELTNNFRSATPLCEYFNNTFSSLDCYTKIDIDKTRDYGNSGVYTYSNYIDVIKTIVKNPKYKVLKKDENDEDVINEIDYGDIMIITKSAKNSHDDIMKKLNENNIPYFVEGKYNIKNNSLLEVVIALYSYIVDDYKRNGNVYNLLTTKLFNLKDYEIISTGGVFDKIENTSLKTIIDEIEKLKKDYKKYTPVSLYERILNNLNLLKYVSFDKMEYCYYILECFKDAYANKIISDFKDGEKYLNDKYLEKVERCLNLTKKPNAVYVANLHKIKGLERPIVILIACGAKPSSPNRRLDFDKNKAWIFKTAKWEVGDLIGYNIETKKYSIELDLEVIEGNEENERLKYVAATRARNFLFIDTRSRMEFWKSLIPAGCNSFTLEIKDIKPEEVDVDNTNPKLELSSSSNYDDRTPSKLEKNKVSENEIQIKEKNNYDSRLKGTIIHRLLEKMMQSRNKLSKDLLIQSILAENDILNSDNYKTILNNVYDKITSGGCNQKNGKDSDILALILKSSEVYTEVPFSYKDGRDIWYGSIDLLYKLEDKYYIVDYKTNYDDTDLDFVYEKQLKAYQKALLTTEGIEAEYYIYHIDI